MTFKNPKGGGVISSIVSIVVAVAVTVLSGGLGLGILLGADSLSCNINLFWGCSSDTSGGGGTVTAHVNDPCAGAPNICGQRNTGFIVQAACLASPCLQMPNYCDDSAGGSSPGSVGGGSTCIPKPNFCGDNTGPSSGGSTCVPKPNFCNDSGGTVTATTVGQCGVCSATTPPDSACPAPEISATGFYATPTTVGPGNATTLHWNASGATACTISGDNGFSYSGDTSGSISTGPLNQTTLFTLTCSDGATGPSTSANVRVILDPHFQEI
jgi:hypothetical protein